MKIDEEAEWLCYTVKSNAVKLVFFPVQWN